MKLEIDVGPLTETIKANLDANARMDGELTIRLERDGAFAVVFNDHDLVIRIVGMFKDRRDAILEQRMLVFIGNDDRDFRMGL